MTPNKLKDELSESEDYRSKTQVTAEPKHERFFSGSRFWL